MYFWLFISVAVLLPSVVMLAMGLLSWRCPPKGVCWYFGYRSRRARASDEVWLFAQHFVGLLWTIAGGGLTLAGLILCYVLLGKDDVGRCFSAAIFLGIAAALVLGIILAAEIVLHVKFDRFGNRRLPKGELEQLRQAQAEAEGIKDAIKAAMGDSEAIQAGEYKITWKPVKTVRIDTTALKKALPDVAQAFSREATVRRFCVA